MWFSASGCGSAAGCGSGGGRADEERGVKQEAEGSPPMSDEAASSSEIRPGLPTQPVSAAVRLRVGLELGVGVGVGVG